MSSSMRKIVLIVAVPIDDLRQDICKEIDMKRNGEGKGSQAKRMGLLSIFNPKPADLAN